MDEGRAVAIEETVGNLSGVRTVRVYPRTASVVIRYWPERCDTGAVLSAITEVERSPAASEPAPVSRSADIGNGGIVGKVVGGIGGCCWACTVTSQKLRRRSRGYERR
ncbi:hypothetical protein I553_2704 [Mycobacterium xenopi 4042]|uniref:HMA domain-containing protein n=1 Tax=Mycobacterium xenopi 4042 TaxID=1299334 RepID=X8CJ19_MYCXE|nr:hypothetical protein I553_2704 [Mycobacterium xenopi 4042]